MLLTVSQSLVWGLQCKLQILRHCKRSVNVLVIFLSLFNPKISHFMCYLNYNRVNSQRSFANSLNNPFWQGSKDTMTLAIACTQAFLQRRKDDLSNRVHPGFSSTKKGGQERVSSLVVESLALALHNIKD